MAPPVDVAPPGPTALPETGLGRGWEPAALLGITLLLVSFGLVSVYSASQFLAQRQGLPDYHYALTQTTGAGIGLVALAVSARIPYRWWRSLAWPLLGIVWLLLVVVVTPGTEAIAPEVNGSRRWLRLGFTLQPSELAKVAVVIWTAALAVKKREHFRSLSRGVLPFLVIWTAVAVPILLEPDLTTTLLVVVGGMVVLFAAGCRIGHFVFLGVLALPLLSSQLQVAYRSRRLAAFLEPLSDPSGAGFQAYQSLVALGSGGITGVGFGEGQQKFGFLPEPHNDFIFALVGEEWGFAGALVLVALYLGIVLVGFRIARRAPDFFGQLLAIGLTSLLILQAALHMGVNLGLLPPTGLSLPFVSYGRSNLVVSLASMGILISVARSEERGDGA